MERIFESKTAHESEVERITENRIQRTLVTGHVIDVAIVNFSNSEYSSLLIKVVPEFLSVIEVRVN